MHTNSLYVSKKVSSYPIGVSQHSNLLTIFTMGSNSNVGLSHLKLFILYASKIGYHPNTVMESCVNTKRGLPPHRVRDLFIAHVVLFTMTALSSSTEVCKEDCSNRSPISVLNATSQAHKSSYVHKSANTESFFVALWIYK